MGVAAVIRSIGRSWVTAARGVYDAIATTASGLVGSYQALDPRRKILPRNFLLRSQSANELATMSLPQLRALCRKLERDNPTARATVEGLVAQVVGTGIALEPDHGDEAVNARLRVVWNDYLHACDISGRRSIYDLQSQAFREVVIAGEFLWRTPVFTDRAARGLVPVVVLPLECEWLALDPRMPVAPTDDALTTVAGIELDRWGQPLVYHLSNPEFGQVSQTERVQAREIIHDFERRRSLQARGEPWLAPVIERIWQEGDLVDAELRSAINCAAMAMVVTSTSHGALDTSENGDATDPAQDIAIGGVARLFPGEEIKAFSHNRPAQQIADFRRTLRGDIAAACRVDQRWLDKDYGRANYSSLRAAMLDSDRLLAPVREWFGRATIGALYERALPYLCVLAGVKLPKRIAYRLIPDGQPYVDPLKDAQAALLAIAGGLTTHEAAIGARGGDYRQVWQQLAREDAEKRELGLTLNLTPGAAPAATGAAPAATGAGDEAPPTDANGEPLKPVESTDAG